MKKYFLTLLALLRFPSSLIFLAKVYISYFLGLESKPLTIGGGEFSMQKSFIRWGDGETMACLGIPFIFSFDYERSSKRLAKKMKEILSYTGDNIVIGVATDFLTKPEKETTFLRSWIITRHLFGSNFSKNKHFDDAFFFRKLKDYESFLELYKWKKVFMVTNQASINKILRDGRLEVVGSYALPPKNAFDIYDTAKPAVIEALQKENAKDVIVMLAGGPMAKVLAYDLTTEYGYTCHDTGQFFDLFLQ